MVHATHCTTLHRATHNTRNTLQHMLHAHHMERHTHNTHNTLQRIAPHCIQDTATHCNTRCTRTTWSNTRTPRAPHCTTLHHIATQHVTTNFNTLQQHTATHAIYAPHGTAHVHHIQRTAQHCTTRHHIATQHVATHCNTHTTYAPHWSDTRAKCATLHRIAPGTLTLQHIATHPKCAPHSDTRTTHCNKNTATHTLQHTHCNTHTVTHTLQPVAQATCAKTRTPHATH